MIFELARRKKFVMNYKDEIVFMSRNWSAHVQFKTVTNKTKKNNDSTRDNGTLEGKYAKQALGEIEKCLAQSIK